MPPDPSTNAPTSQAQAIDEFVKPLTERLRRHPKRVVFTGGEDLRVLRVAERLVREELVVPILLGNADAIRALAKKHEIELNFIRILEPRKASEFELFCQRLETIDRYRGGPAAPVEERVATTPVFASLMVQYGHADALVGGNRLGALLLMRAFLQCIQPLPDVPRLFGTTILTAPHFQNFGEDGVVLMADTMFLPIPTVDELASIAIETGRLAHHLLGRGPRVAMLSHSTMGSARNEDALRVVAATAKAKEIAMEKALEMEITGEVQADVAMDPAAAEIKLGGAEKRGSADVLVFPNLDAAHISLKLLRHCGGAASVGPLVRGLGRPVAQVPKTVSEENLYATSVVVAVEAINYHELYPEGDVNP